MRLIYKVRLLSMAALGLASTIADAGAQQSSSPQLRKQVTRPISHKLAAPTSYTGVVKKLDRQVDIPNMPTYPGKTQYLGGRVLEVPGANTYTMTFLALDPPSRVRDWYVQAFSGYNWKQTIHPTPHQVSGMTTDGSGLTVSFSETTQAPYKSQVMVMYHERKR